MNVLVLHTSALHLGFLGFYGNSWVATPQLDRLAAESVVFDQHYAAELGSLPEATGLGQMVRSSGAKVEWLRDADAVPGDEGTALEYALERALTAVENLHSHQRWLCWVELPALQPPWDLSEDLARSYLTAADDEEPWEPLLDPPLGPIDPDDLEVWERLRCTYAAAITYYDTGVGLLCAELRQRGWLDDLCLIFTADRGLALGEHGMVGEAQPWLHEEVVHLPLLLRLPAAREAGRRSAALTQPADVAATLLECFDVPVAEAPGKSLLPVLHGETDRVRDVCRSHWKMGEQEEWSLRSREWAFLLPGTPGARGPQLYAKPEDRWEVNNVIQHHLELAEQMEAILRGGP